MARIIRTKRKVEEQKEEEVETPMSEKKKAEETAKKSEREKREARKNRERVRLLYAGSGGLNKVERGGFVAVDARRGDR